MTESPMIAHTDGAAEPNPGHGGCAYILRDAAGRQIEARGFYLGGDCSNNVGEYMGVVYAAEAAARYNASALTINSDSRLIVEQLRGKWCVKSDSLQEYHGRALDALSKLPRWSIQWIPREQNSQADTVAGNAVRFRRNVDYSGRAILEPALDRQPRRPVQRQSPPHKRRFKPKPKRQTRGSVYPSNCFRSPQQRQLAQLIDEQRNEAHQDRDMAKRQVRRESKSRKGHK
jgi:ribonuclease HI